MSAAELFADPENSRTARLVTAAGLNDALARLPDAARRHAEASGFEGGPSQVVILPVGAGVDALVGAGRGSSAFEFAGAAMALPEGGWALEDLPEGIDPTEAAIAFLLGSYQFTRYKSPRRAPATLVAPEDCNVEEAARVARGVRLTRDLVNTPAGDMLPSNLEAVIRDMGEVHGASVTSIVGDDLLAQNYPMIHAVGRAADDAPRLIELEWGDESHPRLALVGKGVCFDSGGLDIKPANGMLLMKKDMGGAANVLGLAEMIMSANLPVRLHVLIPAVENAISGNAFRPGDILKSRKGLTVEIGNTDAEGRLVLADAITKAAESDPDLLIDMATLTGAARVALGPELAPVYTAVEGLAEALQAEGKACDDLIWPMPLHDGYDAWMESEIADLSNTSSAPFAGSVTAALFLRRFANDAKAWAHFDIFAWNPSSRPGKPAGGEMLGARALYRVLKQRYGG
jgi:leucyl aminopeptidase